MISPKPHERILKSLQAAFTKEDVLLSIGALNLLSNLGGEIRENIALELCKNPKYKNYC
jgi:hypothetical protein